MSFSLAAFSEVGFSDSGEESADSSAFLAFLASIDIGRSWILEIEVFPLAANTGSPGTFAGETFGELSFGGASDSTVTSVFTLYFSSHGFTSKAGDTPARTWYDGRLGNGITVDRRITGDGIGGIANVFSEVTLVNSDGALDTLSSDYALDGREARILVGEPGAARSDFGLVFTGIVSTVEIKLDSVTISLSDGSAALDRPLNETVYLGTGGLEGGADLAGKTKPKAYGVCLDVPAVLVDSANLIYQIHDGIASGIPMVYDRQTPLTEVFVAPGAGQYQVDLTTGTFQLGSSPAGTVTADVLGDVTDGIYVDTRADIIGRILRDQVGLYDSQIDPSSFAQLDTEDSSSVGIWCGTDAPTAKDKISELLGSSAFGGFSRFGTFTVGQVRAADGPSDMTFTEQSIATIERISLPSSIEPIAWRVLLGYQKNYTVMTDVAGAVPDDRRTFAAEEFRVVTQEDLISKSRHLLAVEYGPLPTLYAEEADAQTEVDRLFALWGVDRRMLQLTLPFAALILDIGKIVTLQHRRFGLSSGVPGIVLSHAIRDTSISITVLI